MRYGVPYHLIDIKPQFLKSINDSISNCQYDDAEIIVNDSEDQTISNLRKCKIGWLKDEGIHNHIFDMINEVNDVVGWNFDLRGIESPQYTVYESGNYYDWHVDQHPYTTMSNGVEKRIRKLSASIFLNEPDEYDGGELELELAGPSHDSRNRSFKLTKGSAIIFQSDTWHRVLPVKSGVRKSLVVWSGGPPYI